jgi:Uma2 family endonuclease
MIQRRPVFEDQITFDQFCTLVGDGKKADLIDGGIYMASPDSRRSNNLTGLIYTLIDDYLEARSIPGEVYVTRFAFKLSEVDSPEPDVAYVGPDRLHLVLEGHMEGAPHIAVEIVSRDSRERDYVIKRDLYEAAEVQEYWIVDPLLQRVQFLALVEGRYELMPLERNRIFRSKVIPGFWLDVSWLLEKPVPRAYRCLQEILAVQPGKSRKRKK